MRKTTREAAEAFINGTTYKNSNTSVFIAGDVVTLSLYGNAIATRDLPHPTKMMVSLAGWSTNTTRERLNGLLEMYGIEHRFGCSSGSTTFKGNVTDPNILFSFNIGEK